MELEEGDLVESEGTMMECGGGMMNIVGRVRTAAREVVECGCDLAVEEEIGDSNGTGKGKEQAAVGTSSPRKHAGIIINIYI